MMDSVSPNETEDSIDIILSTCKEKINIQMQQRTSLESKANTLSGFAGVILALLLSAIETITKLDQKIQIIVLVGVILFALSMLTNFGITWIRRYRFFPNISKLYKNYALSSKLETKKALICQFVEDWEENGRRIGSISILLGTSHIMQAAGFLLLALAFLLAVL